MSSDTSLYLCEQPGECPIQVLLIVSMLEFIVANALGKAGDTEEYIKFIREQWGLVGEYINCKRKSKKIDSYLILSLL